jgi:hypothetical protein
MTFFINSTACFARPAEQHQHCFRLSRGNKAYQREMQWRSLRLRSGVPPSNLSVSIVRSSLRTPAHGKFKVSVWRVYARVLFATPCIRWWTANQRVNILGSIFLQRASRWFGRSITSFPNYGLQALILGVGCSVHWMCISRSAAEQY